MHHGAARIEGGSDVHPRSERVFRSEGVIVVGGWAKYPDPESGASYWYNHDTGASQWDVPHEVAEYRRTGAHPHDDQEAVHEVHDLDDLFS